MPTFVCAGVAPLSRYASRVGIGVFVEFVEETALRIPGGVCRKRARWHEPFRFERENAIGGRNLHARRQVVSPVRGIDDPAVKRAGPRSAIRPAEGDSP